MHAVILDIDGTLLHSYSADGLYAAAVERVLGPVRIRTSWGDYLNVTDSGILQDICVDNDIAPDLARTSAVAKCFYETLALHIEKHGPFEEMPGARLFVSSLMASANHAVAYATGGWSKSAALKLSSAGFPTEGLPLAGSDFDAERVNIMQRALDRLGRGFETITYYGDGEWDRVASLRLGWRFVPVGAALGGLAAFTPLSF